MKKRKKYNTNKKKKLSSLQKKNDIGYLDDLNHICKLGIISENKKNWIEATMLILREKSTLAEVNCGNFLISKKIKFINQAPFILDDKIFFADFFIPDFNIIIEIDGKYHDSNKQKKLDAIRDFIFNGYKIHTIRIPNAATYNQNNLKIYLDYILNKKSSSDGRSTE